MPPLHARYNDLLAESRKSAEDGCGETEISKTARRKDTWWRKWLKPLSIIQFVYFTFKGAYVLVYIRYGHDPLGIGPVALGLRTSTK